MRTENVDRQIRSPEPHGETEDAASQSFTRDEGSTSTLVAMVGCNVILLLMLSA